jgi:RNA polymerase sigma-70 factor (ECF subfamily)
MSSPTEKSDPIGSHAQRFATTRWSIVLAAGQTVSQESTRALEALCETYWLPVYAYVRRVVVRVEDAQDLTQGFFAQLLEKEAIAKADPERGRFRAFLLTALKNFLTNERLKARAEKRGGGKAALSLDFVSGESRCQIEPSHELTPERLFERRWVLTLLDLVLDYLKIELAEKGKEPHFEKFKAALTGEMASADYEQAAEALGLTAAAAKQAAYRLRKRYRELFRLEVARTVADDSEVDDEIGRLLESLGE